MKQILKLVAISAAMIALNACSKDEIPGPAGPVGPAGPAGPAGTNGTNGTNGTGLKGSLYGKVALYGQDGIMLSNHSGATVSVGNFTAVSDATGYYKIDDIPTNTYNFKISKSGYVDEVNVLPFVGGDVPYSYSITPMSLYEKSTRNITKLVQSQLDAYNIDLTVDMDVNLVYNESRSMPLIAFFSKDPKVSNTNYLTVSAGRFSDVANSKSGSFYYRNYNGESFKKGDKVYYVVYPFNPADYGFDKFTYPVRNFKTINDAGKTAVLSFIMP